MTFKFSKLAAVMCATLLATTAIMSSTNSASANEWMRGGHRMGMEGHRMGMEGHRHMHRDGGGFGTRVAVGMAVGLVGALIAAQARENYIETHNRRTHIRTRVHGRRGHHVVTRSRNGHVISRHVVKRGPDSASSTDPKTGITTTSVDKGKGVHEVTRTDRNGKVLGRKLVKRGPASASSTDSNGITTTVISNGDGSRTVVTTNASGKILASQVVGGVTP